MLVGEPSEAPTEERLVLRQKEVVSYNHSVYNSITMAKKAATKTKKPVRRPKKPPFFGGFGKNEKFTIPRFDADAAADVIHKMVDRIERGYNESHKNGESVFSMGNFTCKGSPASGLSQTDLPEIPQQVKELYQSSERLCIKVAELEKALESVLKGAAAIVKTEPKEACSPLGRDLSQLNARLSGLNETVETITLRLAI